MPRARTDINWDAVKVIWLNCQHTSEELGAMFGISADAIRGRAFRGRWNQPKRIKQDKTAVLSALPEVRLPASPAEIVERAEKLRGPASFRRRVAEQAERIIDKLEAKGPESIRELDSFAEVLVKTEKVGAGLRDRLRGVQAVHQYRGSGQQERVRTDLALHGLRRTRETASLIKSCPASHVPMRSSSKRELLS